MKRILIFAGTTEGRKLAQELSDYDFDITVCVATAYGEEQIIGRATNIMVHTGRMDSEQIAEFIINGKFACVADATHPYAAEATKNIYAAAKAASVKYIRLLREKSDIKGCDYFSSIEQAVERLNESDGNIFAATGSKELEKYKAVYGFEKRLYVRILPSCEAIKKCEMIGLPHKNIIAMQGPFSYELNKALFNELNINVLVTKDGGIAGGFKEKLMAADSLGIKTIVIGRPNEQGGLSYRQALQYVLNLREEH